MDPQVNAIEQNLAESKQVFFENKKYLFYLVQDEKIILEKAPDYAKLDEIFYMEFFFVLHKILNYLIEEKIAYELFIDKQILTFKITISFRSQVVKGRILEAMTSMFEMNTELY